MQKIEFKNLPNTDTPITAENLNAIQDNVENEINDSSVVVSATEPTGNNRKKVWMQKGKNLFDKDNIIKIDNYILNDSGTQVSDSTGGYTKMYISVKSNTQYAISNFGTTGTRRIYFFDKDKNFISRSDGVGNIATITTPDNCCYIDIQYYLNENNFDDLQIEQGSSATTYEAYIDNKIYIKNDNDVYEEFISREKNLGDDILNNFYGFKKEYYDRKTIDCNDMVSSGIYILDINNTISNKPNSLNNNVNALLVMQTQKESIVLQIWFNYNSALYYRWKWWGTWGSWKQITIS